MSAYRMIPGGTGGGGTWGTAIGLSNFKTEVSDTKGAGDTILISKTVDSKANFNVYTSLRTEVTSHGSDTNKFRFTAGSYPSTNAVLHNRYSAPYFIGDINFPWTSGDDDGVLCFFIQSQHTDLTGLSLYHFSSGIYLQSNSGNNSIYDTEVFNASTGIYIASTFGPTYIDTFRAAYIRKTGIRLYNNVKDVTIKDAKIDMSSVQGAAYPNGVTCNVADNLNIDKLYVSNVGFTQSTTGVIQDSYIQGDGVTMDSGTKVRIRNSHFLRCADRGIDCKATDLRVVDSTMDKCKYGIGIWSSHPSNKLIGCTIKNIQAVRDEGACIQSQGYIKVIGCNIHGDAQSLDENSYDIGSVFRTNVAAGGFPNSSIEVVGGKVYLRDPKITPLIRFYKTGDKIILKNVMINDKIYNKVIEYNSSTMSDRVYLSQLDSLGV